jgi:hypothetical protein
VCKSSREAISTIPHCSAVASSVNATILGSVYAHDSESTGTAVGSVEHSHAAGDLISMTVQFPGLRERRLQVCHTTQWNPASLCQAAQES